MPTSTVPSATPDGPELVEENRRLRTELAQLRELRGDAAAYRQNLAVNTFLRLARDCHELSGELKADVYVAHGPEALPAADVVAKEVGGRVYCDVVEMPSFAERSAVYDYHPTNMSLLNHAFDGYLRDTAGLTTIGWALKEELRRYGRPVTVIPNYRRAEELQASNAIREESGLGPEDRLVLASSTICSGFAPIVEALKLLPDNVHLATLGSIVREYREEVYAMPERFGVAKRVHFFDPVPYDQLVSAASGANLALMAVDPELLNDRVSLPNRLFDCIAAGLPVITPDVADIAHIVEERRIGLTVARNDAVLWAEAIKAALADEAALRARVQTAAQKLVWESLGEKLHSAYGNPQRVTLIAYCDLVGHQRTVRMVDTLVNRGVRVTVCCPHEGPVSDDQFAGARFVRLRRPSSAVATVPDAETEAAQDVDREVGEADFAAPAEAAARLIPTLSRIEKLVRIEQSALDGLKRELISLRYKARRYDEVKDNLGAWRAKAARYDQLKNASGAGLLASVWRGLRSRSARYGKDAARSAQLS